jgi:hypothetical protein
LFLIYFKQQARASFAEKLQHIGTFDSTREKAAFAYEIVREKLKIDTVQRPHDVEASEAAAFKSARDAAFEAVGVRCLTAWEKSKVQDPVAWQKSKVMIDALNAVSGGKNNTAAALVAEQYARDNKDSSWQMCELQR